MTQQDWREALRRRVEADSGVVGGGGPLAARVEAAVGLGAAWLAKQAVIRPEMAGLCLDYVSRHIVRRWRLMANLADEPEASAVLSFLAARLEKKGVDVNEISVRILAEMLGPVRWAGEVRQREARERGCSIRPMRSMPRSKQTKQSEKTERGTHGVVY